MKKILLSLLLLPSALISYGQATLTAATNNPVPGDWYNGHWCDPTGITPGASGASVTWNFASLTQMSLDTSGYYPCTTALECDSFPGADIIMYDNYNYYYYNADATELSMLGTYVPDFSLYLHFGPGTFDIMSYPFTYNSTHTNTFEVNVPAFFSYHHQADSFICDGWGTLILPSGTHANVLRVHNIAIATDSNFTGTGWDVSTYQIDNYYWYTPGFHNPLLSITIDTATSNSVAYYTVTSPLSSNSVKTQKTTLDVFPNPAQNVLNLKFDLANTKDASITLSDMLGRVVATITNDQMHSGTNEVSLPVTNLPDGMYIVCLHSAKGDISRKVMISK
ncbi:MAG: hypothetical protein K0Q79_672 [Flavipsychrobacter sp.]|jgi:hypothetical protein|nr:hypothetical protein [Flavipsychrobacter sp.]